MRRVFLLAALPFFLGGKVEAQPSTNMVRWNVPTNSLEAAQWPWKWKSPFAIAPNTPAFEAYGLEFMLTRANEMREKWQLDIPQPLTVKDVFFAVYPTYLGNFGIEGHLLTRDKRFHWSFDRNVLCSFEDRNYFAPSFRYQDEKLAVLAKVKSKIDAAEAEKIARQALFKLLGKTEKELGWRKNVLVNQHKFEESDGTIYPLPLFHVEWKYAGPKRYAADNVEAIPMEMEVSGITAQIANYSNYDQGRKGSVWLAPQSPTNFFKMLGLPDNYLDTVPERKRRLWGLPPLTNSLSKTTNSSN